MEILANPWEAPPVGIIDEFAGKTCALRVNQTLTLNTGAGENYIATIIKCNDIDTAVTQQLGVNDLTGAVSGSAVDTPIPGYADLATHYSAYRPVSMGVKVYYVGAEGATSGTVSIVCVNGVDVYTKLPADADDWFNMEGCKTVACASMTGPLCAAVHSYDRPNFDLLTRTDTHLFFPTVVVFSAGLPASTSALRVEISYCLELIPVFGSILVGNTADVVMHDPLGQAAAHRRLPSMRTGELQQVISPLPTIGAKRKRDGSSARAPKRSSRGAGSAPKKSMRVVPMGRRTTSKVYIRRTRRKRKLYRRR